MLTQDMMVEILSNLPVQSLLRFTCVSKSFKSLIFDPRFVKLHLQKSPKNTNFLLRYSSQTKNSSFVFPSDISSLFEHSQPSFAGDRIPGSDSQKHKFEFFGSCNGLVCLGKRVDNKLNIFYFWNPATRNIYGNPHCLLNPPQKHHVIMLGFGYDKSRDAYKIVAIVGHRNSQDDHPLRSLICNVSDDSGWRDLQNFPADPFIMEGDGIYLDTTINWLGLPNNRSDDDLDISFDELVIVSLDLGTETYTQLLLPGDLNGVLIDDFFSFSHELHSNEAPVMGFLNGCLSIFLNNRKTQRMSIWQMKEFGNQKSWTRLLNTSLQDLGVSCAIHSNLLPLCMIQNDRDIIIIQTSYHEHDLRAIVYNRKYNTVESKIVPACIRWVYLLDYVESLVSPKIRVL